MAHLGVADERRPSEENLRLAGAPGRLSEFWETALHSGPSPSLPPSVYSFVRESNCTAMNTVIDFLSLVAQSPWAFVVLAGLLIVDGFFPAVPGETAVVTLAVLGASGHGPSPIAVLVVATAATMIGDGVAFLIGRKLRGSRATRMSRRRVLKALEWTSAKIATQPATVLIAAKFLPVARVAVTIAAGSSTLSIRRYVAISFAAAALYTLYHVVLAASAGALFAASPLLGLAVSIGFGVLVAGVLASIRRIRAERRVRNT